MLRYHVFLSHSSADKPAVERLAHKLREAGIEPFLDKWHLIPGQPWQEALEEALDQSRTCAVFIGRELGPWQNEEMRVALDSRVRGGSISVIPVLLPGAKDPSTQKLPSFLSRLVWVDFRGGIEDPDAFQSLLAGINAEPPGPGSRPALPYRCMAPAREPFVQRSEYAKVRDALLVEADGSRRAATVGITTAIHGAGGFGKTALAIEICYDERVRERYPSGILWTTMGEEIDDAGRLARVRDLIRWWTEDDPPAFETVSAASAHLRKELEGKRVLLVIDDVWRPGDITPFQGLAAAVALLITTRDSRTLPSESVPVHVDALEISEAVRMLGAGLPYGTSVDLRGLATRLGKWPLLLKIVNRQLRELIQDDGLSLEKSLQEVTEALDTEGLTVFDREDFESRDQAVARTVGASLRRLSGEEVERFEQLAIFPEDKDVPLRVLEKFWGWGAFATKKLCDRLHDRSLLLRFDRQAGTIRLHDVIRAYLLKKEESRLAEWNQRLLDAYRPANGCWSELPRDESYIWGHLAHHLVGGEQAHVCRELLMDFRYLISKLRATDINALIADYSPFVEKDQELRLVRDALRLSAHVLIRNPDELRGQLWGRLLDRQEPGIRRFLQASTGSGIPWFRPRKASLTRPGGALIRTIDHPGEPNSLAVLPGGRVVSGSEEGILRVWDVERGQPLLEILEEDFSGVYAVTVLDSHRVAYASADETIRVRDLESGQILNILEGHSREIETMAVLDSHRVVSASKDGTLRVWDVESGQTLKILEGHYNGVSAVAVLDSRRVVSAFYGTLWLWDVESGKALQTLEGHSGEIRAVAVLGSRVIFGSYNGTLQVWDVESGRILQTLKGHSAQIRAVAVLDSRRVVSASEDTTLRVWDVEGGKTLQILEGHSYGVHAVAVLDSHRVISGSEDETLRVWDVESGQTLQALNEHSDRVSVVAVLDSRRLVSSSPSQMLWVWDIESGQTLKALNGRSFWDNAVAVLDSRRVVIGSLDGALRVWDVESGRILKVLEGHSGGINALAVLDNRRVVSSDDPTLQVWDVESGQLLQTLEGHSDRISAMAVLNSRWVVSGSWDRTLRVWDVESGETLWILEEHSNRVCAVAVLDSRRVVSASDDTRIQVWDVESGVLLQTLKGHSDGVSTVATLDRYRIVSGSYDQTLRVWNVENGEVECLFTLDAPVTAVAVIPNRHVIVAGDASGRIHFLDLVES